MRRPFALRQCSFLPLLLLLLLVPAVRSRPILHPRAQEPKVAIKQGRLCVAPAPWMQILSFFLTNYIARVATFKKTSGYKGSADHIKSTVSLFVPFYGISQAAETIARGSRFLGRDELGGALHARALCVLQRNSWWRPRSGDIIRGCTIEAPGGRRRKKKKKRRRSSSRSRIDTDEAIVSIQIPRMTVIEHPEKFKIQGQYKLPEGYCFSFLPAGTALGPINPDTNREDIVIASSYGTAKSFTGVLQIIISIFTLYSSSKAQIESYGYAAFGFSVIPYTVMSFLNAIANFIEADYDTLFMVESEVMVEAFERTGEEYVGAVAALLPEGGNGEVVNLKFRRNREHRWKAYEVDDDDMETGRKWRANFEEEENLGVESGNFASASAGAARIMIPAEGQYRRKKKIVRLSDRFNSLAVSIIVIIALVLPYITLGSLSKFKPRGSTARQRTFMMGWLVVGQIIGVVDLVESSGGKRKRWWNQLENAIKAVVVVAGFAFAVGGFIEAGRMMRESGFCFKI